MCRRLGHRPGIHHREDGGTMDEVCVDGKDRLQPDRKRHMIGQRQCHLLMDAIEKGEI